MWPRSLQLSEDGAQIFGTGSHVRDGPFVFGFFGQDRVLFEGVPAVVAVCPYVTDDRRHIDIAVTEWPIHSLLHGLAVGELTGLHPRRNRRIDVLQVQMRNPLRRLAGELGGIGSTDE